MLRHLGYSGATRSIDACTSRSCRPEEASPDRIRSLIRDNLRDLGRILRFQADRGIGFYRVDSRIIPSGPHPGRSLAWWDEFAAELDELGAFAAGHGQRLEMDPGEHCLLNSPSPETVALSILELGRHVHLFEAMRLDASHKLVIRIGGTFGDKVAALGRFVSVINGLPESWRVRLAVEDVGPRFDPFDVLEASEWTDLPVVLAWPRSGIRGGSDRPEARSIAPVFATWRGKDGPPIVHLGGPKVDVVELGDLEALLDRAPLASSFDCLIEAEEGDRALFALRERMGRAGP